MISHYLYYLLLESGEVSGQETVLVFFYKALDGNCYYLPGISVFGIICLFTKMLQVKSLGTLGKFFCLAAVVIYIIFFLDFLAISIIDFCQYITKGSPSSMADVKVAGRI